LDIGPGADAPDSSLQVPNTLRWPLSPGITASRLKKYIAELLCNDFPVLQL
jgi:hypothetical protein